MKKGYIFFVLWVLISFFLTACEQNIEPKEDPVDLAGWIEWDEIEWSPSIDEVLETLEIIIQTKLRTCVITPIGDIDRVPPECRDTNNDTSTSLVRTLFNTNYNPSDVVAFGDFSPVSASSDQPDILQTSICVLTILGKEDAIVPTCDQGVAVSEGITRIIENPDFQDIPDLYLFGEFGPEFGAEGEEFFFQFRSCEVQVNIIVDTPALNCNLTQLARQVANLAYKPKISSQSALLGYLDAFFTLIEQDATLTYSIDANAMIGSYTASSIVLNGEGATFAAEYGGKYAHTATFISDKVDYIVSIGEDVLQQVLGVSLTALVPQPRLLEPRLGFITTTNFAQSLTLTLATINTESLSLDDGSTTYSLIKDDNMFSLSQSATALQKGNINFNSVLQGLSNEKTINQVARYWNPQCSSISAQYICGSSINNSVLIGETVTFFVKLASNSALTELESGFILRVYDENGEKVSNDTNSEMSYDTSIDSYWYELNIGDNTISIEAVPYYHSDGHKLYGIAIGRVSRQL